MKFLKIVSALCVAAAASVALAGANEFKTRNFEGEFRSARYYAVSSLNEGSDAEVAFIVVHGWGGGGRKSSDAEIFAAAAEKQLKSGERAPYVLAPLFPMRASLKRTKTPADGLSVWNDSWGRDLSRPGKAADDWRGGGDASNGKISSFEVIDHIFTRLGDKKRFPNLRRVVLAGFSAGGQFVARYAAVGRGVVREGVEVAYIAMSPSTWLRLDDDTPWHYGLKDRPRYAEDMTKEKILANLASRDILYACGGEDTGKGALDRTPSAMLQGTNRLKRFYSFKKHVESFPGWRKKALFNVVPGLKHNGRGVYNRPEYFGFIMRGEKEPFASEEKVQAAETDWTRTPGHVTVEWKDGKTEWTVGGYADIDAKKPMEKDALFWAASNTKGIAAALVLTFVDEGKIDLDAPVENYFPQWRGIKVVEKAKDGTETRRAPKRKPTVRHVLSHMSGLAFFPKMPIDQYPMRELVDIAVEQGLRDDPGVRYRYSNWGIDIAVAIAEKVGGKPWEMLLKERVLDPLGMKGATFWPTKEEQKRIVVPYHFPKGGGKPIRGNGVNQFSPEIENRRTRHAEAGGGLYATADDFLRFFAMVANRGVGLNGKRILSENICREWYRRQTPSHVKASYSFGMVVDHAKGTIEHGGAYATHGVADWRDRTCRIKLVQKCSRPPATLASETASAPSPENVPGLMISRDGKKIASVADWERARAPEILERYRNEVFGVRPRWADDRARVSFEVVDVRDAMDGAAKRKIVTVKFDGPEGVFSFPFTVFIPKSEKRVPAFVFICNRSRSTIDPDRGIKSGFWPAEEIVARGYATAAFLFSDIAADDKNAGFAQGVFPAMEKPSARDSRSWASISAWAWAASRVLDWMETEPLIDAERVGVVGHSRGGKTAIWAGVNDPRFAMVCSNDSGCSGAKLNHINLPQSENIETITRVFPHWFCGNYRAYAGREREMDFDQHQLLALVAPRLLCVASASEDHWAGPQGEWWAAKLASPAWELYGRKGLTGEKHPGSGVAQQGGFVSYHQREGKHDLMPYDWHRYMDFADRHSWRNR